MDRTTEGWISGFIGVLIFSGSLPATRVAVLDIDPLFLTLARATIAGLLGRGAAARPAPEAARMARPPLARHRLARRGDRLPAADGARPAAHHHGAIPSCFVGLLPLATAIFGILRGGERPQPAFWLFSGLGGGLRRRLRPAPGLLDLSRRQPAHDRRHPALRARLCGGREARRAHSAAGRSSPGRWFSPCR